MKKAFILVAVITTLLTAGFGSASAQDNGGREGRGGALRELIEVASEQTGLTAREIVQNLREGSSLAELIQASGGNPQVLIDAAYAQVLERIDRAEMNGRISAERAAEMRANALETIRQAVNGSIGEVAAEARLRTMASRLVIELAIEQTGLSPRELGAALRNGATLADVLVENSVSLDDFIVEATERASARLNVLVADGRITAERAAELLSEFTSALAERLNGFGASSAST